LFKQVEALCAYLIAGYARAVAVLTDEPGCALAAPTLAFCQGLAAESPGRNNSGAKQIDRVQICTARKSKAGSQSRNDAMQNENDNKTIDFLKGKAMPAIQFLNEVKDSPIDAADILTDEQLGRGGLIKIEAFVRTKTSAAAARKAKQRELQKAEGIHTVTLTIPAETKKSLQAIAAEMSSGKNLNEAILSVTSRGQITKSHAQIIGERVLLLKGWRLMIAKAIGII
jgi:hypothetical protein